MAWTCGKMEEGHLMKKITTFDVEGARPRGRPWMGWVDSVKTEESIKLKRDAYGTRKSDCA